MLFFVFFLSVQKNEKKEEDQNNKENKPRNGKPKDEKDQTNAEVDEVMTAVKNILNDRKVEACASMFIWEGGGALQHSGLSTSWCPGRCNFGGPSRVRHRPSVTKAVDL